MRILCFGDSNTYGYDPRSYFGDRYDAEQRWVDLVASKTGHEMINCGLNGREIPRNADVLRLLEKHGSVVLFLVMLGTNDLLQGASAKDAATRMEAFLQALLPYCSNRCMGSVRCVGSCIHLSCRGICASSAETERSLH